MYDIATSKKYTIVIHGRKKGHLISSMSTGKKLIFIMTIKTDTYEKSQPTSSQLLYASNKNNN